MASTRRTSAAAWAYLGNTVLLTVHEIDAAYWHEWELLGIPGGIAVFLMLHVPLLALVLWGFWRVVLWSRGARAFSYGLAFVGIGAVILHGTILAQGDPAFRSPVSLGLLGSVLATSSAQVLLVRRAPPPSS